MRDLIDKVFIWLTVRDEEGQGMVEYGLIIALVAIVVIVALTALGKNIGSVFNSTATTLNNTTP